MSNRLTKSTRERMAKALVKHRFRERAERLMAESVLLFGEVYASRYDAQTQKIMRQLERRVSGALKKANRFYVNARGMRVFVGAETIGSYNIANWTAHLEARLVLGNDDAPLPDNISGKIADHALATETFAGELKEAYRKALAALEQFTTGKRLAEEWPEAMPVIGHLLAVEDRSLPVVQLAAINDEFDLPPPAEEATADA